MGGGSAAERRDQPHVASTSAASAVRRRARRLGEPVTWVIQPEHYSPLSCVTARLFALLFGSAPASWSPQRIAGMQQPNEQYSALEQGA